MKLIEKMISEEMPPEVKKIECLRPLELAKRISNIVDAPVSMLEMYLKNPHKTNAIDMIIAKIVLHAIKTNKPAEAVLCAEWLMNRSVGKPETLNGMVQVNQASTTVTYVTTIAEDGQIEQKTISDE